MSNWKSICFGAAVGLTTAVAGPAEAGSLTAQQILSQFNLVTPGSATTGSNIEGSVAVGGNLNGSTLFSNSSSGAVLSTPSAYVFGNLTNQNWLNINDPNSAGVPTLYYNGPVQTNKQGIPSTPGAPQVNFNGRSTLATIPSGVTISSFTAPLNALETQLAGLTATSDTITNVNNNLTFNVVNQTAVFDLPLSDLLNQNVNIGFSGALNADTTIIINVTGGTTYTQVGNFNPTAFESEHVIWNFDDFTSLSFKQWGGAVLGGDASVSNSSPIEGFVYAKTYGGQNNGPLEYYPFKGQLPVDPAVPEPSTWAMLVIGFAGVAFAGLRRGRSAIAAG
ncbi:putative secreted protein with PEP-CTERM sorting signal/choice-of-anchor A domain-containing protein [Roseiarcus fermentans]|uniref:Putative secreted protein with PEP-CTERM sorting signal/choice-of-anchor A domain-containing protein n=1 Tax=Roseiarcus fermentans TaxID=1473586 RepID=A0A366EZV3_9HYPH|nr:collagen-binding domain-containing protein [Roseiarcus fermentans]RBP07416.1 putative secreted protein with PEP-CTERM sorting signal/choice-of-anchor A domain-containing protein [Roseiarcus fermentans]